MAKRQATSKDKIAEALDATPVPGSPNRITVEQMKEWAAEYLDDYDDELARFPELQNQPHWNLWMVDARNEDALLAVLVFRADSMEFFCGTGNGTAVRGFAESHMAGDPDGVLADMSKQFSIPHGSVRLDRQAGEKWLGRSW